MIKHTLSFTTGIIIEPGSYLRYLFAKFHMNKGQTLKRTISFRSINDFEFLHRNFHVVFNCSGLGVCAHRQKSIYR